MEYNELELQERKIWEWLQLNYDAQKMPLQPPASKQKMSGEGILLTTECGGTVTLS